MSPIKNKLILTAALLVCRTVLCAYDIGADNLTENRPEIIENELGFDESKLEALSLYLDVAIKGAQFGQLKDDDFIRLITALEKDSGAEQIVNVLTFELSKAKKMNIFLPHLLKVAEANPHSYFLNIIVADNLLINKRPDDAERLLKASISVAFDGDPVFTEGARDTDHVIVMLAKLILIYGTSKRFDEALPYVEIAEKHKIMIRDLRIAQAILVFRSEAYDAVRAEQPEAVFYIPNMTNKRKQLLDHAMSNYLESVSTSEDVNLMENTPALSVMKSLGRGNEIKDIILQSLLSNPSNVDTKIQLAEAYFNAGEHMNAVRMWRIILAGTSKAPWNFYMLYGLALQNAGLNEQAINAYELSLLIKNNNPHVLNRMAWLFYGMARYEDVLRIVGLMPDSFEKFYLSALSYDGMKKMREAQDSMKNAYDALHAGNLNLDVRRITLSYAYFAEKNKDIVLVEELLRGLILLEPDDHELLNFLGYTLADNNTKLDDAERMLRRAIELAPDREEILDSMAWVCFRLGNYAEAWEWMEKCLKAGEENGSDPLILEHAGDILDALGKRNEAMKYWKRASEYADGPDFERDKVLKKINSAKK